MAGRVGLVSVSLTSSPPSKELGAIYVTTLRGCLPLYQWIIARRLMRGGESTVRYVQDSIETNDSIQKYTFCGFTIDATI